MTNINIGGTIVTPLSGVATHEDIYGKGGYRVIEITTVDGAAWDANNAHWDTTDAQVQEAINLLVPTSRRKVGMLCHDSTSGRYFRQSGTASWVETFKADSDIDLANYVQRSDLPQDANGDIDIASEATLQEALLSSVRVTSTPGQSQGTVNMSASTGAPNPGGPLLTITAVAADPANSTPAQVNILVNPATGGDAADV